MNTYLQFTKTMIQFDDTSEEYPLDLDLPE